nr:DinI-like family protein [Klebsiella pneumoniae]
MRIEIIIDKEQKISQSTLDALESELYRNLRPLYPKTAIRIRKGSANGIELTGLKLDEDKQRVMEIMQKVWEIGKSTRLNSSHITRSRMPSSA